MSIGGINGFANWWQWRQPASQTNSDAAPNPAANATNAASAAPGAGAGGDSTSFLQALSADLQAMFSQSGSQGTSGDAAPGATGSTADGSAGHAAANSAATGMHHRHHHHHPVDGSSASLMQTSADNLATSIQDALRQGTPGNGGNGQSASVLATDLMQALQSYGAATGTAAAGASIVV